MTLLLFFDMSNVAAFFPINIYANDLPQYLPTAVYSVVLCKLKYSAVIFTLCHSWPNLFVLDFMAEVLLKRRNMSQRLLV